MNGKRSLNFLAAEKLKRKHSPIRNVWKSDKHQIPPKAGVYILIARKGIKFLYPTGKSPIYYIGQSESLRKRIVEQHKKHHLHVRDNSRLENYLYEARHEYGGVYGGRYCFIQSWPGITPKHLEKLVIRAFMKQFHAPPVANGAQGTGLDSKRFLSCAPEIRSGLIWRRLAPTGGVIGMKFRHVCIFYY